jgi:hypothetical protein
MTKKNALGEPLDYATSAKGKKPGGSLLGHMKGTVTIAPGVDLTEPAMPEWADLVDEKYGKGRDDQHR